MARDFAERIPATLEIVLPGFIIGSTLGIALGAAAAIRWAA